MAADAPRYVSRIDPLSNTIQLGRREDLETRSVPLSGMTFVADGPPVAGSADFRADARIRHRATPIPATVRPATAHEPRRGGRWIVETDLPVWAAAPGQACVLYDGDIVLGGGRIEAPLRAEQPLAASA